MSCTGIDLAADAMTPPIISASSCSASQECIEHSSSIRAFVPEAWTEGWVVDHRHRLLKGMGAYLSLLLEKGHEPLPVGHRPRGGVREQQPRFRPRGEQPETAFGRLG